MVEAVVAGVGLAVVEVAEVPFTEETGVVAFSFEHGCEADFFFTKVAALGARDGVETGAIGSAASENARSRGRADGAAGVAIGEFNAFFG